MTGLPFPSEGVRQNVATLRLDLEARAAGYWWLAGEWLEQVAFTANPAMDPDVAQRFVDATRSVPMSAGSDLGIVGAVLTRGPVFSRASELPDDVGSGFWIRAFDATRSVAVPPLHTSGVVRAVVAVALTTENLDDQAVVDKILEATREWTPPL